MLSGDPVGALSGPSWGPHCGYSWLSWVRLGARLLVWGSSRPSWGPHGDFLRPAQTPWGASGPFRGPSITGRGVPNVWGAEGLIEISSSGSLGAILGAHGAVLGPAWGSRGPLGVILRLPEPIGNERVRR